MNPGAPENERLQPYRLRNNCCHRLQIDSLHCRYRMPYRDGDAAAYTVWISARLTSSRLISRQNGYFFLVIIFLPFRYLWLQPCWFRFRMHGCKSLFYFHTFSRAVGSVNFSACGIQVISTYPDVIFFAGFQFL